VLISKIAGDHTSVVHRVVGRVITQKRRWTNSNRRQEAIPMKSWNSRYTAGEQGCARSAYSNGVSIRRLCAEV